MTTPSIDIDAFFPVALLYAPEGGLFETMIDDLAGPDFQIQHIKAPSEFSAFSLQRYKNLGVYVFDMTRQITPFAVCMECVDFGYRDAGGPVVVIIDSRKEFNEAAFLRAGAAKVIDFRLGHKAIQLIITLEIEEFARISHLKRELLRRSSAIGQIVSGVFKFRTRREAQNLATMLAMTCPNPVPITVGLAELLINSVEHGCLGIGHEEKGALIERGMLTEELHRRRNLEENANKFVTVDFKREPNRLHFKIKDSGKGFDYNAYVANDEGHEKKHGRGILMATGCFEKLEYIGNGNEVHVTHYFGEDQGEDQGVDT